MYVAVKIDCFRPSATEVQATDEWHRFWELGSDWLVFQVPPMGGKGTLIPYDHEMGTRIKPRGSDRPRR